MKHTNPQVEQMTSFIVMDVLERANELQKQGIDIIHLEVGEPDFDVPACVAEAAKAAYDRHLTHYTHSLGDPELRQLFLPIPFGRKPFSVVPPLRNIAFYACWIVESDL